MQIKGEEGGKRNAAELKCVCRIEEILTNRKVLTQRGGGVLFERRGGNTRMHAGMQQACLPSACL